MLFEVGGPNIKMLFEVGGPNIKMLFQLNYVWHIWEVRIRVRLQNYIFLYNYDSIQT